MQGAAVLLLLWVTSCGGVLYVQPEQVHLAMGATATEMVVTWSTRNITDSVVEYGISDLTLVAKGNSTKFTDGGNLHLSQYIHRVTITNLKPNTMYMYHCGSGDGWSDLFFFKSLDPSPSFSPRFAAYGDLGNVNAQSLPRLQKEVQSAMYDMILHIGDFAYDMHDDNAQVGDAFMRQIEAIAAYVPYMTTPGNHESAYNFSNYVSRFSMPGGDKHSNFYSFNLGRAHFIGFSTEFLFFRNYGTEQIFRQYNWLERDLQEATKPSARAERPWIITMGHRPMYCSTRDGDDCDQHNGVTRTGIPSLKVPGLEDLFYRYGVDVEFWAHEHVYERLWPLYNFKVFNGSYEAPYTNPKAPVHIITGSAGCQEDHPKFTQDKPEWSALRNSDYGYTRMTIHNGTHLYLEQVSDDQGGAIVDSFWIIKSTHGKYN